MALSSCSANSITHFVRVFDFWAANMSLTMWLQWSGDGDRVSMTNLLVAQIEYNYTFSGFFFQMDFRWKLNGPLKGSLTRTWSVGGIEFSFVTLDWNALVQDECNWNFENTYRLPLQIGQRRCIPCWREVVRERIDRVDFYGENYRHLNAGHFRCDMQPKTFRTAN